MSNKLLPKKEIEFQIYEFEKNRLVTSFQNIFNDLNWTISEISEYKIKGHTSLSLSSWGESIEITFNDKSVFIKSECIGNQIIDWNKNNENINKIIQKLEIDFKLNYLNNNETTDLDTLTIEDKVVSDKKNKFHFLNYFEIFKPKSDYFFTPIIAIINILVFIIMAIDGTHIINPQVEKLIYWGANERSLTLNGELWRLITSAFIHIGLLHLVMNMYALLFIGSLLEPLIGKYRFIFAYFITGIVASTASLWWNSFSISAGASGAIFGLFGVFFSLLICNQIEKNLRKPMLIYISIYIGFNLLNGLKEGVDGAAHIGGLVSGIIIGFGIIISVLKKEFKELNYWIFGIMTFLSLSISYVVIEKIPNPIKKYRKYVDVNINYFELYNKKMKDFIENENLAMEIENYIPSEKENALNYVKERSLYYWEQNLKIVNEIEKYSLPEEILKKNKEVKIYTKLRIKQLKVLYNKILTESDKYDKQLIEINQEIDFQVSKIINL